MIINYNISSSIQDHNSFVMVVDFAACMMLKVKTFKTFWNQSFMQVANDRKVDDFNIVASKFFEF